MAQPALRAAGNVPGDFFVDSTCIDCDACRQIAPAIFCDSGGQSVVSRQPATPEELLAAQKALIACPTASIGSIQKHDLTAAVASFPEEIEGGVYRCGYTSESSFGAFSYFVRSASGNLLVDSPRFARLLVRNLEASGGVTKMLLTHRDDVADHDKFAAHFGCERVLHRADVGSRTSSVEIQPEGGEPVEVAPDVLMIPTPGHTRGHAVFLYRNEFLFTGDHLAWNERRQTLYAFRSACWYSWSEQIESMRRLLDYRFSWVLPGHGRPIHLGADRMRAELERCVEWMQSR